MFPIRFVGGCFETSTISSNSGTWLNKRTHKHKHVPPTWGSFMKCDPSNLIVVSKQWLLFLVLVLWFHYLLHSLHPTLQFMAISVHQVRSCCCFVLSYWWIVTNVDVHFIIWHKYDMLTPISFLFQTKKRHPLTPHTQVSFLHCVCCMAFGTATVLLLQTHHDYQPLSRWYDIAINDICNVLYTEKYHYIIRKYRKHSKNKKAHGLLLSWTVDSVRVCSHIQFTLTLKY